MQLTLSQSHLSRCKQKLLAAAGRQHWLLTAVGTINSISLQGVTKTMHVPLAPGCWHRETCIITVFRGVVRGWSLRWLLRMLPAPGAQISGHGGVRVHDEVPRTRRS